MNRVAPLLTMIVIAAVGAWYSWFKVGGNAPAPNKPPPLGPAGVCQTADSSGRLRPQLERLIGARYEAEVAEIAGAASGAMLVARVGDGAPLSSDHRPERLVIFVKDGVIRSFACG